MKRFFPIVTAAVAALVMFASCDPEINGPKSLIGAWQSQTINSTYYYLDVPTETEAVLSAYTDGMLAGAQEVLALTYDANTGKGTLSGNGRSLTVTALNDTAFSVKMSAGEFVFTPATGRPVAPTAGAAEGYWYSSEWETGLLVCPAEADGGIPALMCHTETDLYETSTTEMAYVGSLVYTNDQQTAGTLRTYDAGIEQTVTFDIQGDLMTCVSEAGVQMVLNRQPAIANAPASAEGVWSMSYSIMGMVLMTLTATVQADGNCIVEYRLTAPGEEPETDTMNCKIYYCPVAGVGAIAFDDEGYLAPALLRKPAVTEDVEAVLFKALSSTAVQLSMSNEMGIDLIFRKQ